MAILLYHKTKLHSNLLHETHLWSLSFLELQGASPENPCLKCMLPLYLSREIKIFNSINTIRRKLWNSFLCICVCGFCGLLWILGALQRPLYQFVGKGHECLPLKSGALPEQSTQKRPHFIATSVANDSV